MAKYNWEQFEKEFVLGSYKYVFEFLKEKNIKRGSSSQKYTKDWIQKKEQYQNKLATKTLEKVIEKESTVLANKIFNTRQMASDLGFKIEEAMGELNKYIAKSVHKTKTIKYDYETKKPSKETIEENEKIEEYFSIIDRKGLKELTSALKDINDILNASIGNNGNNESLADKIQKAYEKRIEENNVK